MPLATQPKAVSCSLLSLSTFLAIWSCHIISGRLTLSYSNSYFSSRCWCSSNGNCLRLTLGSSVTDDMQGMCDVTAHQRRCIMRVPKLKVGSGLYILLSLSAQQFDGIRNILLHASWQKSEKKNEWKTTHNDAPILIDDDDGTCAIHHQLEADQIIRQADRYFHYNDVTFDLITPHACNRVTNVRHITSLIECHTNHVLSRASLRAMLTAKWLRRWWWRRRIYMRFAAQRQKNQK